MTHDKKALSSERFPRPEKLLLKSQLQGRASSPQGSPPWASVPCTRRRLDSVVDIPPPPVLGFQVGRPGPFSKIRLMRPRPSYGWSLLSKRHPARTASRLIFSRALPVRWGWCDPHFREDPEEALRPREVKKSQAQGHIDSGWWSWGAVQGPH